MERIVNGLARVTPLHNWEEPIVEAYFPKLTTSNGGILWGSRPSGLVLKVRLGKESTVTLRNEYGIYFHSCLGRISTYRMKGRN